MVGCYLTSLPHKFMRTMAGHPASMGSFEIRRAGVLPPVSLTALIWPELDQWIGRFGPGPSQYKDLAAAGLGGLARFGRIDGAISPELRMEPSGLPASGLPALCGRGLRLYRGRRPAKPVDVVGRRCSGVDRSASHRTNGTRSASSPRATRATRETRTTRRTAAATIRLQTSRSTLQGRPRMEMIADPSSP